MTKKWLILAVATAVICITAGCMSSENRQPVPSEPTKATPAPISAESERFLSKGLAAYGNFQYDEAMALYDQALKADNNNYKAVSAKGIALAMKGNGTDARDVEKGIALIRRALEMNPQYVPAYYDLALALKIHGDGDEAIKWFQKVIEKEPDNTWSYYGIATIYGDRGDAENALPYLKKALALDPDAVRKAAQSQSHFDKIRSQASFKALFR